MRTAFIDTETLGLYSPMVTLQYKFSDDDQEPQLYCPWTNPASRTIKLIEKIVESRVVAHNLTFDWQKLQQFYCGLKQVGKITCGRDFRPIDHVFDMAEGIYAGRNEYCLKPRAAVCTLLLCQKQLGGTSLATKEIRVRKVPMDVAGYVVDMLNKRTDLPEIMFARRKNGGKWDIAQSDAGDAWADVALRFAPSNALKDVSRYVLDVADTQKLGQDIAMPPFPYECGYAPYATLLRDENRTGWFTKDEKPLWPRMLQLHLDFWWTEGSPQMKYALDDIVLLEKLYVHLGSPDTDFDSELSCQVSVCRTAGFKIEQDKLEDAVEISQKVVDSSPVNVDSPNQVREYIQQALDPMEVHVVAESCDKVTLKKLTTAFVLDEPEECCTEGCPRCDGQKELPAGPMPVAIRADKILDVRKHAKRLQLYRKLEVAKGAFPSFRVIGTKSGRMSGADGLNYHGIDGSREIREIFSLADRDGWVVSGGDMNSQELAVAAAVMNDKNLSDDIGEGRSLHAVFAASASGLPYEQIMKNKEDKSTPEANWYKKAKICVYAILYGAASFNIAQTLGVEPEEAEQIILDFFKKYPYMAQTRKQVKESLEALRSDVDGHLQVVKPKQTYIDSVFGFRREFVTEYAVMEILFAAMKDVHKEMKSIKGECVRKEEKGKQTYASAVSSALYGSVFSLQGKILRAALNHTIQSAGRTITLRVQKRIWDEVQPCGVHPFKIKLLSVHDEIITTSPPSECPKIRYAVAAEMADLCKTVPLLSLDWAEDVGSWHGVKAWEDNLLRCGWEG